ncbi:SDR family NAD(P)-dependent oxidoreductase [Amycolatopsis sp. NPDC004368]
MNTNLQGKVALVTGGSRGIGAECARQLAAAGADVAVGYLQAADKAAAVVNEARAFGVRASAFRADQADREQVERLVDSVGSEFGQIDILVNSAGVFAGGPTGTVPVADIERMWAINVHGLVATTQQALKYMPDGGRIINLGSVVGERAHAAGLADYSATKAAISMYGRSWSHEFAPRRITVNTVAPMSVETDMRIPEESPLGQHVLSVAPLHRYATPQEVAATVLFLASPEASYVSGADIRVDGAWNA